MSIQRCCPEAPVYDRDLTDEATLFKALGDPARVAILATIGFGKGQFALGRLRMSGKAAPEIWNAVLAA
jgi:hypothetical protein